MRAAHVRAMKLKAHQGKNPQEFMALLTNTPKLVTYRYGHNGKCHI